MKKITYERAITIDGVIHALFFFWCALILSQNGDSITVKATSFILLMCALFLGLRVIISDDGFKIFRLFSQPETVCE
jgi:hypothetical protein